MSVVDKFLNYMKLNDEDEDFYDEDYLDEDEEIEEPVPRKAASSKMKDTESYEERAPKKTVQPKVTPIRQNVAKKMPIAGMEVCVIKPVCYDDSREVTETLLSNRTVVLNLEGLDTELAQRIIDFVSGSCFAIDGNLQRISNYIFIITPASVDISGDFQDILSGSFETPIINNGF